MFTKAARFVSYNPWKVIAAWIVLAAAMPAFAPTLNDVLNQDEAGFLPASYESVQAQRVGAREFAKSTDATAIIVLTRADRTALRPADQGRIDTLGTSLTAAHIDRVAAVRVDAGSRSPNQLVQLVDVQFQGSTHDKAVFNAIKRIRAVNSDTLRDSGLRASVTGEAAVGLDNQDAYAHAITIVGGATTVLIIVLLLLMYRSPIAALLPLVSVGVVYCVAPGAIALVGKAAGFQVDQQLPLIITIVLFGVGTDYILFLLFRYRELLRTGSDPKAGLVAAVERVAHVITSAAAAIVVTFMALLLASFGAFRSLGPGLAITVAIMALATLTLIPAVVSLLGTRVFWPSKSWQRPPAGTSFARLGRFTARRPALVALAAGGLMVVLALGMLSFRTDYDELSQLPDNAESVRGFSDLATGFPAGALNPTLVYLQSTDGKPVAGAELDRFAAALKGTPGVAAVIPTPTGAPGLLSPDGRTAQVTLLLKSEPFANAALDTIGPLRAVAHAAAAPGTVSLVGGETAGTADIRHANNRDLVVILPAAGALIAVILALLLWSLVAPLYLMVTVVLVFFSTMGATAFLTDVLQHRAGVNFSLPIILYLFVMAIGTDYNILMITRLREEAAQGRTTSAATALGIAHGGPSVGAAGTILAGTFASSMLSGIAALSQMGIAVALGIVLSAFVISLLLVPSLTALIGRAAWWPSKLYHKAGKASKSSAEMSKSLYVAGNP